MKLKQVALLVLGLLVSGQALGMSPIPDTPEGRKRLWDRINQDIAQLERSRQSELREYRKLPGKAEIPDDLDDLGKVQQEIEEKQAFADRIYDVMLSKKDTWIAQRSTYPSTEAVPPSPPSPLSPPSPPSSPSSSWITPQRGALVAGLLGLGYVYHKVPWTINRIKRILKEHGKKFSDLDRAEKKLFMSASRARFNPAGAFFLQEALLDLPTDFKLRDELWPILNHVYYGKKQVSQKQARALRKLYDEAKELMKID